MRKRIVKRVSLVIGCLLLSLSFVGCASKASQLDERIDGFGTVTAQSLEELKSLDSEYQTLSDADKQKVEQYDKLSSLIISADFLASIDESIEARMANADSDDQSYLVNAELARLDRFRGASFSDDSLADISAQYLDGLDNQKKALLESDYECEYQRDWNTGLVQRYGALKRLHDEYGFKSDDAEFVSKYVMAYEERAAWLDAFNEIEADIDQQMSDGGYDFGGSLDECDLWFSLENNTPHSFESVWEIEFMNDSGTILYEADTVVQARPNSGYVVKVYAPASVLTSFDTWAYNNWYSEIDPRG